MEKQFQEVFPDLRIEGGMAELLDTVEVSRVSINKKKDLLRIYVVSHQWIHKKYIYQLERQIEEQLFSNVPLRVKMSGSICRASIRRKTFWRCTVRVSCSS